MFSVRQLSALALLIERLIRAIFSFQAARSNLMCKVCPQPRKEILIFAHICHLRKHQVPSHHGERRERKIVQSSFAPRSTSLRLSCIKQITSLVFNNISAAFTSGSSCTSRLEPYTLSIRASGYQQARNPPSQT